MRPALIVAAAAAVIHGAPVPAPPMAPALAGGGKWSTVASMAAPRSQHTMTVLDGPGCGDVSPPQWCGMILVAGGRSGAAPTATAELFDPATGAWSETGSMAAARSAHSATLLDGPGCDAAPPPPWCGRVLVAGGPAATFDQTVTPKVPVQRPSSSAEIYDPATGTWSPAAAMSQARSGHTATALGDGTVLVVGGTEFIPGSPPDPSAELYDPATGAWTTIDGPGVVRVDGHSATVLDGPDCGLNDPPGWCGEVLIAGGRRPEVVEFGHTAVTGAAEAYDPATGQWRALERFITAERADHSASPLPGGAVLFAGGFGGDGRRRASAETYDPGADAAGDPGDGWEFADSLELARAEHAAVGLEDGRIVVAGGDSGAQVTAERIASSDSQWSFTGPMASARRRHAAVVLSGPRCGSLCGGVLVAGGVSGSADSQSAELYDPGADTRPGRVTNLRANVTRSEVDLLFSAAGAIEGGPPAAQDYVVKQSLKPFSSKRRWRRAPALCGGTCSFDNVVLPQTLEVEITGVLPDHTYYFALKAVDAEGDRGPRSNVAEAAMPAVPPGKIRGLSVTAASPTRVKVRFRAAGSDGGGGPPAREYVVKKSRRAISSARAFKRARSLCGGVCRFDPDRVGQRLTLVVTRLRPGTTYHFALRARDNAGNLGPRSDGVRARTPS